MADPQMLQMTLAALQAIYSGSSTNEDRTRATEFCEQVKKSAEDSLAVASQLIGLDQLDTSRHFGLSLIASVIEGQWHRPGFEAKQQEIKQLILQMMASGTKPLTQEPRFIKDKLCCLLSAVGCREWPQRWPDMFESIFAIAQMGHTQAELAMTALRLVGEDIMEFNDNLDAGRRSDLSQALKLYMPQVVPFVTEFLQSRYSAMLVASDPTEIRSLELLVDAALQMLQSYCCWLSLALLHGQRLLPLFCSLLGDPRSRVRACECVFLLCERKLAEMSKVPKGETPANNAQIEDAKAQLRDLVALMQVTHAHPLNPCTVWKFQWADGVVSGAGLYQQSTPLPAPEVLLVDDSAYTFVKQLSKCVGAVGEKQLTCFDPPPSAAASGHQGHTQHIVDGTLDSHFFGKQAFPVDTPSRLSIDP
jgi:hypothetical protein